MRYWLLDKIRSYKPEVEVSAVKNVTMTEGYLADHLPEFPARKSRVCRAAEQPLPADRTIEINFSEEHKAMSTVTSKSDIYSKVQEALVDALGVDEDEVKPEATLQGDLGAESIDFLDIVF